MRLLYATDGSEGARIALDFLLSLPLDAEYEVRVLTIPLLRTLAVTEDGRPFGPVAEAAFEAAADLATRVAQRIRLRGAAADAAIKAGPVGPTILEEAHGYGAELIVVGSRGFGALRGVVLGSAARWLADRSPIPVLVVRDRAAPVRVLIAVDDAHAARRAYATLDRLGIRAEHASVVASTRPGEILDAATGGGADLIVLASERLAEGDGLFATSVAAEVLVRAHCAVLLAAPAPAAARM